MDGDRRVAFTEKRCHATSHNEHFISQFTKRLLRALAWVAVGVLLSYAWVAHANSTNTGISFAQKDDYQSNIIREGAIQNQLWLENPVVLGVASKVAAPKTSSPRQTTYVGNNIFVWPTAVYNITQYFKSYHQGIDISNSQRVEVYAAADGKATFVGYRAGYGNTIIITHENGYQTLYAHLSRFTVEEGQEVKARHVIGFQGNTGSVRGITGIHLHFAIILNNQPVNPLSYFQ